MKYQDTLLVGILFFAVQSSINAQVPALVSSQPTAFTMSSGTERTPEQLAMRFDAADLQLKIDPETRSIEGDARLIFSATKNLNRVVLELDKNLPIELVQVNDETLAPAAYRNPEGRLSIDLPKLLLAGESLHLRIRYHGSPRIANRAPWDGGMVWSKTPTGDPWIASAVQGEGCDLLWPCIDHPMGKPQRMQLHFSVPAPLVVAGNGIAQGMDEKDGWRTYHWRIKNPATYGIAINAAPYALLESDYESRFGNHIPLKLWYLPANKEKAQGLLAEFAPMLDFFESVIGPYPFADEKMGVVETPHLGMEHQTINAYGNDYLKSPHGYDWLLQHEFAHEWFGNQMTNENWDDFWLHEGFATYMQPLYLQYLRGERDYQVALHEQRLQIKNKFVVVTGHSMSEHDVSNGAGNDVYYKGSLMLHTLRNLIGDAAFFKSIKRLVYGRDDPKPGNFSPRYSSTKEFIHIVEQESKRDLGWFFHAYLMQASLPQLRQHREGNTLKLEWKIADGSVFPMPIEVRVEGRIHRLKMKNGRGEISLPSHAHVNLDPRSIVLRDEARIEIWQEDLAARRKARAK